MTENPVDVSNLNEPSKRACAIENRRSALKRLREIDSLTNSKVIELDELRKAGKTWEERKALDNEVYDLHVEKNGIMNRFNIRYTTSRGYH